MWAREGLTTGNWPSQEHRPVHRERGGHRRDLGARQLVVLVLSNRLHLFLEQRLTLTVLRIRPSNVPKVNVFAQRPVPRRLWRTKFSFQ